MKIKFSNGTEKEFSSLVNANLREANLRWANLREANLREADLSGANLSGADLREADLSEANLREADLSGANLREANLREADLREADLREANLREANLREADLAKVVQTRTIVGAGTLRVFKKLRNGVIAELEIPAEAKRVGGVTGRKCRAEFARVISGEGFSNHQELFYYQPGAIVRPDKFDDNPLVECAAGIHFFITREEAEAY